MAEPAKKLDGATDPRRRLQALEGGGDSSEPRGNLSPVPDEVYDQKGNQPDASPSRLQILEGGDETTDKPNSDHIKPVEKTESLYKTSNGKSSGGSPAELAHALEKTAVHPSVKGILKFARENRGKLSLGGLGLGIVALIVIGIFALIPFKVLHVMNNLQDQFFATSEKAMDKEVDRLFSNYIKGKIKYYPTACKGKGTGKFIDHTCNPYTLGDSLVTRLYKGWSNGKLEEKLLKNHGLAFAARDNGTFFALEFFDDNGNYIDYQGLTAMLDPDSNVTLDDLMKNNSRWSPATRAELRAKFKTAFEDETRFKRTMYRIKVAKLLRAKYGIKFCSIGCPKFAESALDNVDAWERNKKRAMKIWLAERVLIPKQESYKYLLDCLISGECNGDSFKNLTPSDYSADVNGCNSGCDINGEPQSAFDREIRTKLISRLLTIYNDDLMRMVSDLDDLERTGGFRSTVERRTRSSIEDKGTTQGELITKKATQEIIKKSSRAIPIIGWVSLAADVVNAKNAVFEGAPKMIYVMNATAAAQFFALYRTHADEIKEGKTDAEVTGSYTDALGGGIQTGNTADNQLGGDGSAEDSLFYQRSYTVPESKTIYATMSDFFAQPVSALSSPNICNENSEPIPDGKLVCDEVRVRQEPNTFFNSLNLIFNGPQWAIVDQAAQYWQSTVGKIIGWIGDLISKLGFICTALIPGCKTAADIAEDIINDIAPFITGQLLNVIQDIFSKFFGMSSSQIDTHMSGLWAMDNLGAGADVSGNDFAHYGLGGRKLSKEELATIVSEQANEKYSAYKSQSFFARMTDQESPYSPLSRLAMSMPTNKGDVMNRGVFAKISNPFKSMFNILGSLFSAPYAMAAAPTTTAIDDPFGITAYGYTDADFNASATPGSKEDLKMDSDEYWKKFCVSSSPDYITQTWNEDGAAGATKDNGLQPENTTVNRCLLIQAAAGSAGAVFTDEVLTPDEKAATSGGTTTPSTITTPPTNPPAPPNTGTAVNGYVRMPAANGIYTFNGGTPAGSQCGSKTLVDLVYGVAQTWAQSHPNNKLVVGDLNAPGHLSHRNGIDVDIYTTGRLAADVSGDRNASIELGKLFVDSGLIQVIYFNDTAVQAAVNAYAVSKGLPSSLMQSWPNHDNHFHVRILDQYRLATTEGCPSGL